MTFPFVSMPWRQTIVAPVSLGGSTTSGAVSSLSMTTGAAIPSGALAVVGVILNKSTTISVTSISDGTNSYTLGRTSTYSGAAANVVELWYCANAAAKSSSSTITVTPSVATDAGNPSLIVAGYVTPIQSLSPLDAVNSTAYGSSATAYSSGATSTLSRFGEIAFGLCGGYTGAGQAVVTEGAGFTLLKEQQQGAGNQWFLHIGYQIVSATTALNYQPTLSVAAFGASVISTFKGA